MVDFKKKLEDKMQKKNELVTTGRTEISTLDNVPDYLKTEKQSGLEGLGKDDFKVPRIKMLQALNPEIREFQGEAIPGEFWHTGSNISLSSEFVFTPISAAKRVVLWDPNEGEQNGTILAYSKDALNWHTGGNQKFNVTLKGGKEVVWDTGKNVPTSGLTEWGSSNSDIDNSAPAAQLCYEYICYLHDYPEISPCIMMLFKTALISARSFNTSLLMLRKPTTSIAVRCYSVEKHDGKISWFVPQFKIAGYVPKDIYETTKKLGDQYKDYQADLSKDDVNVKDESVDY